MKICDSSLIMAVLFQLNWISLTQKLQFNSHTTSRVSRTLCSVSVTNQFHPVGTRGLLITRAARKFLPEPALLRNRLPQMWSRRKTCLLRGERRKTQTETGFPSVSFHILGFLIISFPNSIFTEPLRAVSRNKIPWCSCLFKLTYDGGLGGTDGIGPNSFGRWRQKDEGSVKLCSKAFICSLLKLEFDSSQKNSPLSALLYRKS